MKKIIIWILAVVALIIVFFLLKPFKTSRDESNLPVSYKDATYLVDGKTIKLTNGTSEIPAAPGSASKITTKYFGNEIKKDLDGDGKTDVAFILTQNSAGSGTFFYVVGALNKSTGWVTIPSVLLGDRISPQTTESGPGKQIIVNYVDRKFGEPMTTRPSVGKSLTLLLDTKIMQFGQVMTNF